MENASVGFDRNHPESSRTCGAIGVVEVLARGEKLDPLGTGLLKCV